MRKSLLLFFVALAVTLVAVPDVWAEAAKAATAGSAVGLNTSYFTIVAVTAAAAMTLAACVVGFGQSLSIKSALEGIARNPGSSGKILPTLLLGLAMMESLAIYVLVIALILLFANPFLSFF
ncbi:MAG: hypothetical protein BMS9Abin23_0001 [Thermodesulfobacteriota bacterium]|nr:MAG: hypothetical protein BMS9Abin23_0001 [Thermodesulfobacteriota bacterium]